MTRQGNQICFRLSCYFPSTVRIGAVLIKLSSNVTLCNVSLVKAVSFLLIKGCNWTAGACFVSRLRKLLIGLRLDQNQLQDQQPGRLPRAAP